MSYQTPLTIKDALERIQRREFVLPAIQREFTWGPQQICALFDSLMQGYPIGGFLFWEVEAARSSAYKWYGFMRDYHQWKNRHCPVLDIPDSRLTAILDGQQRLTSLNIGLRGSFANKKKYGRFKSMAAYPTRQLYVNLKARSDDDELGLKYGFRFLTQDASGRVDDTQHWFRVADVWGFESGREVQKVLIGKGLSDDEHAYDVIYELYEMVHKNPVLPYFVERNQDLDRVLDIFIRVNSGGTPLSKSDLLLSVATAQWTERDAREAIHELVDELNETGAGFSIAKNLVLKAGLMLADVPSVAFVVRNFTAENMGRLERGWDAFRASLKTAVEVLSDFGFSSQTLAADSVIIPVAYYIHRRGVADRYRLHPSFEADRNRVRAWVCCSLAKSGIWGSGLDNLLLALRAELHDASEGFPVERLEAAMARRGKSLSFSSGEVEDLLDSSYSDKRTFALLSLMYPFVNLRHVLHADHIFPRSLFTPTKLRKAGVPEDQVDDFRDKSNRLANLQLLEGTTNQSKHAKLPAQWLTELFVDPETRAKQCQLHDLGDVPERLVDFDTFYEARRKRLARRLSRVLGVALSASAAPSPAAASRDTHGHAPLAVVAPQARAVGETGVTAKRRRRVAPGRAMPPDGTRCRFAYKGEAFEGHIEDSQLQVAGQSYPSLSAASVQLTGTSRNGWLDWELQLPGSTSWIAADAWRSTDAPERRTLPVS